MSTATLKTEVGSYFISNYPPYSQWTAEELPAVTAALHSPPLPNRNPATASAPDGVTTAPQPANSLRPLGLYLHIPFCRKRCKFCYFRVYTDKNSHEVEDYVAGLAHEIELVSRLPVMGERPFRFVYFGGGTPSFLSGKQLTSLVDRLRANINWDQAEEVTFECEPGTLSEPKIKTLRELGVTRLSLGVENFSDAVLEENGRAHLSAEVYKSWDWIVNAGFASVNIDLIAGMVGETWENWQDNIARTLALSPDSVTIYQLELPFNTVYSKDILGNQVELPVADWPTKRTWMEYAYEQLTAGGYDISSAYTLVKRGRGVKFSYRDNLWRGSDLLATGVASFGHVSDVHYQNLAEWGPYLGALNEGRLPLARGLAPTPHQLLVREMILQLKTGKLDTNYFQSKFGVDIRQEWADVWADYAAQGYLEWEGPDPRNTAILRLTRAGLLRVDGLLPAFFEAQHQGVRYT
ncbi:MAG: coproporphyrinogen-III oxidase family protein [Pirellulales bacterium]|nr:coproporphyrinogen-III oxidase family protein [Pirellulales bacterium]